MNRQYIRQYISQNSNLYIDNANLPGLTPITFGGFGSLPIPENILEKFDFSS
jgi:hypothetical protein